jgi:EAL domain-containing protein (putative c-di-GMP-specific phosphodiesterase class I)
MIAMAHTMKMNVVAEGVETADQSLVLRAQQCDLIQGYLISKPVTARTFTKLLVADPQGTRRGRSGRRSNGAVTATA